MIWIYIFLSDSLDVGDGYCANPGRILVQIVIRQFVGVGVDEELRYLRVSLEVEYEAASQIFLCALNLVGANRLSHDPANLTIQAGQGPFQILGRRTDISDKPAWIQPCAAGDVAVGRVGKALLVSQYPRNPGGEPGTGAKYRVEHQQSVVIRIFAVNPKMPHIDIYLLLLGRDVLIYTLGLTSRRGNDRQVKIRGPGPAAERLLNLLLHLSLVDVAHNRKNRVVGNIVPMEEIEHILPGKLADGFRIANRGPVLGMPFKHNLIKRIRGQHAGYIEAAFYLSDATLYLLLYSLLRED